MLLVLEQPSLALLLVLFSALAPFIRDPTNRTINSPRVIGEGARTTCPLEAAELRVVIFIVVINGAGHRESSSSGSF
jgi:hypothetical protein